MTNLNLLPLLIALGSFQGVTPSREASDTDTLRRLETVWNEAHVHGDADALEHLWGDDLEVAVPKMAVMTKSQALAFARSGRMRFQKYDTSDLRIRVFGDAAIVTGRLQRARTLNGQSVEDNWRFTKVYIRRDGNWQVVAFHASEAASP
jgi:ketosteroid isomerase-like protein